MAARKLFVSAGQRFGKGVVIDPDIYIGKNRAARLRCDCGNIYEVKLSNLVSRCKQSCGCLSRQSRAEKLRQYYQSPEGREARARLAERARTPENLARLAEISRSPERRAQQAEIARSPENLARLAEWRRSPENLARLAERRRSPERREAQSRWVSPEFREAQLRWARSPENLARLAEIRNSPENLAHLAEIRNSPEGRARLVEWARSEENLAHLAEIRNSPERREAQLRWARSEENLAWLAEMNSIPRTGSAQEPVYACPDCGDGNGKILAFRTQEEETAHFAGYPHGRGKRADTGVLVAEFMGGLARR